MKLKNRHIAAKTDCAQSAGLSVKSAVAQNNVAPSKTLLSESIAFYFSPHFFIPILSCTIPGLVFAGPQGGEVVAGSATITNPNANSTLITQSSTRAAIDWQRFNIGSHEYVQFVQPDANAVALNRVIGGNPSEILGNLSANGQVFLVNPSGIYFGQTATINVGGIVASVLDISNKDFMSGKYTFAKGEGAPADAGVVNDGLITASDSGYVVLMGDYAYNNGIISARMGTIALAAGSQITMDVKANGLVSVVVEKETLSDLAGVKNTGIIEANGGRVMMTAKIANDLIDTAINNEGLVVANSITERNGAIYLTALGGDVVNSGTLDASAEQGSNVDGGGVLVYSDKNVTIADGATIKVSGDGAGNGGVVRAIAEDRLVHAKGALIDARGGEEGEGGFVEVSGHGSLAIRGDVELGSGGELLIDPAILTIRNNSLPTSPSTAFVNKGFLETQLNSGANVTLVASNDIVSAPGSGSGAGGPTFTITATGNGDLSIVNGTISVGGGSFNACTNTGVCTAAGGTNSVIPTAGGNISLGLVSFNLHGNLTVAAGTTTGNVSVGSIVAGLGTGNKVKITAGGSINVSNIAVTGTANELAEISLFAGGDVIQSAGSFNVVGGAAHVTAKAGGNVNFNGNVSVTAIAGGRVDLGTTTQLGNAAKTGQAKVTIHDVGGNVAVSNITAIATATNTSAGAAPITRGDAELEIDGVAGNVTLTGTHTIKVGDGQGADADLQIRNVIGNVLYSGTADISAGTQGTGIVGSAGLYRTTFEVTRVGGNVTLNGGGISVRGGANNGLDAGDFVAVDPDSIGGKLDINTVITVVAGNNRHAALDIDRIGGALAVSTSGGLTVTGTAAKAAIVAGTANFAFNRAAAGTPCLGASCGDVNITAPVNLSIMTTAGVNKNSDARITVDKVFGNLTVTNTALLTLTGGIGAGADASFDIGGGNIDAGQQGVRGNVTINGNMIFVANGPQAADASLDIDFVGGNVTVNGNMNFDANDDARVKLRQIGGDVLITGNAALNANAGATHNAIYDIKGVKGNVTLSGTKDFVAGDDAISAVYVHDVGGNVIINNGATLKAGNRIVAPSNQTDAEVDMGRIAGNVTVNGNTVLQAGNNAETGFNIHEVGGLFTAPVNAYDDTVTAYAYSKGGCTPPACGVTVVNGDITQNFNPLAGTVGAIGDADINFNSNIGSARINGNIISVSQTSLQIGAASGIGTTAAPVNLTINGNITAASNVEITPSGNLAINGIISLTGSSLLVSAGGDLSIGTAGGIGTAANLQNAKTTLTANGNVNINGDIFVGSNTLTLAADNDGNGSGDVNIFGSATQRTIKTKGAMLITGQDLMIIGAGGESSPNGDASVLVEADDGNAVTITDNITISVAGNILIRAGSVSVSSSNNVDVSVKVHAGNDLSINAGSLNIRGGRGSATIGLSSSASLNMNAEVLADRNIDISVMNDLSIRGGNAVGIATGSDSFTTGANIVINSNAKLGAGGLVQINAVGGNLSVTGGRADNSVNGSMSTVALAASARAEIVGANVSINNVAGSITIVGGDALADYNIVGFDDIRDIGNVTADAGVSVTATGNLQIMGVVGSLGVRAGTALSEIGDGNSCNTCTAVAIASALVTGQNITIDSVTGDLDVTAGLATSNVSVLATTSGVIGNAISNADARASLTATQNVLINVDGAVSIAAGTANVGGNWTRVTTVAATANAYAAIKSTGNVDITAGTGLTVAGGMATASPSTVGFITGTASAQATAKIMASGDLTVNVSAGSINLAVGIGASGTSGIPNTTVIRSSYAKGQLDVGGALKMTAANDVIGSGADITADAISVSAGNNIDLQTSNVIIGSGTVSGVLGDAIVLDFLSVNGVTLPTTPNPNAKFSAGNSLSLGVLTMAGDVPYLWLEADNTSIQGVTTPAATDILVQYSAFTKTSTIGVENVFDSLSAKDVNFNNLEHFSILPGTTVIIGDSTQTGAVTIGSQGNFDISAQNMVFVSSSAFDSVNNSNNVISSGFVAELQIGAVLVPEPLPEIPNEDFVPPVLTEVEVSTELEFIEDIEDEKERRKKLVTDDEEEIKMCEAG